MRKFPVISAAFILTLTAPACGPKPTGLEKTPVSVSALTSFARTTVYAQGSNNIFFWKEGYTAADVAKVKGIVDGITGITNATSPHMAAAMRAGYAFRTAFERLSDEQKATWGRVSTAITRIRTGIRDMQADIDKEKAKPDSDRDDGMIEIFQMEVDGLKEQLKAEQDKLLAVSSELVRAAEAVKAPKAALDTAMAGMLRASGSDLMMKMGELSDMIAENHLARPDEFLLTFGNDGRPRIRIRNWAVRPHAELATYSSEDETVTDASYTEKGGLLNFTIRLSGAEAYFFKLERVDENNPYGLAYFSGDIRCEGAACLSPEGKALFTGVEIREK